MALYFQKPFAELSEKSRVFLFLFNYSATKLMLMLLNLWHKVIIVILNTCLAFIKQTVTTLLCV